MHHPAKHDNLEESSPDPANSSRKFNKVDLEKFDEESIFCMLELLMCLMENDQTPEEFFKGVIVNQEVKKGDKKKSLKIMNSASFFDLLRKASIWKHPYEHDNLKENLKLDSRYPDLLLFRKIKDTLETLKTKEEFM